MKIRLLFILLLSFVAVTTTSAQKRTVTNEDLEKFRQKRLAAERDLRENYERLGFPSPEELQRQIEQSRVERENLSARLRAENLERERIELERQIAENEARNNALQLQQAQQNYPTYQNGNSFGYAPYGFYGFPTFGYSNRRFNRGGFGGGRFGNQPRVEYRNNLPVILPPAPQPIFAPGQRTRGGRRN
jgi:hypothetical protein